MCNIESVSCLEYKVTVAKSLLIGLTTFFKLQMT